MPRATILKASTAARRATPNERCFDLSKQPIVIERITARIFEIVVSFGPEAAIIEVEKDIVRPVADRAPIFKDKMGKRTEQFILQGLARLEANGYINYCPHRDDIERIRITSDFQVVIQDLVDTLNATFSNFEYNAVQHHRFICCFFRTKFRRNFKRNATRRELEIENRKLVSQAKEHSEVCPMSQIRSSSVASQGTEAFHQGQSVSAQNTAGPSRIDHEEENDSIYVDDVPRTHPIVSGSTILQTPARPTQSFNDVGAYPSPESMERTVPSGPLTPALTPSRSGSVTTAGGDQNGLGDVDMDLEILADDPPRTSIVLFNHDVSSSLQKEHQERLAAMRLECGRELEAKALECNARLQDKDRWWSRKINSVRKTYFFRRKYDDQQAQRRMKHQVRREKQPLLDAITGFEDSRQQMQEELRQEQQERQTASDNAILWQGRYNWLVGVQNLFWSGLSQQQHLVQQPLV